jgi:ABC-type Fe3+ transport system permease subunit
MKKLYIYSIIAIIVIIAMSILKGYNVQEGFIFGNVGSEIKSWFKSEYFIIPILMTLIIGPIIYLIYLNVLRKVNKTLTAVAENVNQAPVE